MRKITKRILMRPQATKCMNVTRTMPNPDQTKPKKKRVMLSDDWCRPCVRSTELRKIRKKDIFSIIIVMSCVGREEVGSYVCRNGIENSKASRMKTIALLFSHSLCAHSIPGLFPSFSVRSNYCLVNGNMEQRERHHANDQFTDKCRNEWDLRRVGERNYRSGRTPPFRRTINSLTEFVYLRSCVGGIRHPLPLPNNPQKWVAKSNFLRGTFPFIESIQALRYIYHFISFWFAFDFCENCKATGIASCVVFIYNITENARQPAVVPQPAIAIVESLLYVPHSMRNGMKRDRFGCRVALSFYIYMATGRWSRSNRKEKLFQSSWFFADSCRNSSSMRVSSFTPRWNHILCTSHPYTG